MRLTSFVGRFVFLILVGGVFLSAAPGARPPNVLLVLTDDQGYGDFSIHGNTVLQTPQIDLTCGEEHTAELATGGSLRGPGSSLDLPLSVNWTECVCGAKVPGT